MPKFTEDIVDKVIELLKTEQFQNCLEISDYLKNTYGIKISRRTIGDINRGDSHRRDHISYPISKKYARNFLTTCCICGKKSEAIIDGKEYCHRHYMQMYHHGEILKETIYDPNEFIEYDDYVAIILKNQYFEPIAITKVDKEDWPRVKQYKWYCHQYDSYKKYCQGTLENGEKIRLHHFVLRIDKNTLQGKVVDHINGDSLDNRKANLRIVSQAENMRNMKPNDPMKGIRTHTLKDGTKRYSARITVNYKTISLGTFNTLEEAQKIRKQAEIDFRS